MAVPDHPEVERALAYIRRRGTDGDLGRIVGASRRTFDELEDLVAGLPEAVARRRPAGGGWCVQEVVDHLVESDRPAVDQLRQLLAGDSPSEVIAAGLQSADPLGRTCGEALADLRAVHRRWLELLDGADGELVNEARAGVAMVLGVDGPNGRQTLEWVQPFDWKAYALLVRVHNQEHVGQVRRILAQLDD